jgi:uncharacterized protein (DUF433 family)
MTNTFKNFITLENGKRSGQPCIRGLRITVGGILAMLGNGMSMAEIQEEYDELTLTQKLKHRHLQSSGNERRQYSKREKRYRV